MVAERVAARQPWANCLLTDLLITYLEETHPGSAEIDYAALFRGIQGFEGSPDPRAFLRNLNNWVPLPILRDLLAHCERLTGRKDFAYHAALAYFNPDKKHLPSLLEIIARVLNDARQVVICSNLWSSVLVNYARLQSFERPEGGPGLFVLAEFDEIARPSSTHLLLGVCEGFPRLYPFIEDTRCIEEISQVRLEDIVADFPGYTLSAEGDRLRICAQGSRLAVAEAAKVRLGSETVSLSREFLDNLPDPAVVLPRDGQIQVLAPPGEAGPVRRADGPWAYRIVRPGTLTQGPLSCALAEGQIYNAPYSRLRFVLKERPRSAGAAGAEGVRREISQLLFDHLKQMKQTQMRMVDFNIERRSLRLENIQLRQEIAREYAFAGIISRSAAMRDVLTQVRSIAETDMTALIQGETGTGKELIARAIHYNSPRRGKRFVAVNCGALADTLLESELFGHEKGAFTGAVTQRKGIFEAADGGTLFLDEVGEIKPGTQVKLLRVLQEGEIQRVGGTETLKVDVRVVAATNRRLEDLVAEGQFRQDLYYRLNVFPIIVPPLRDRPEDIPLLVSHILERRREGLHKAIEAASPEAMALLMTHRWPGNVRELENVVQRMMVVAKGKLLGLEDLPPEFRGREAAAANGGLKGIARKSAGIVEKKTIEDALAATGGNVSRAAKALGISRATLQNKMKAYGLRQPKSEAPGARDDQA